MNHTQRLKNLLSGAPVDRPAVALWRHFPVDDQRATTLAAATLQFQQNYDFDVVKVTPASGYSVYDWGVRDVWEGNMEGTRRYTQRVVQSPADWGQLPLLDPHTGHLGEMLKAVQLIIQETGDATPVLETVFNPLSQAKKLVGDEHLMTHIKQHPAAFKLGLEIITESTVRFIRAAAQVGIAGVFFAVQHARGGMLTPAQYAEFGETYDRACLAAAKDLWLNALHLHGTGVYFEQLSRYPVQAINWHDRETAPDLAGGLAQFDGLVCGGLRQWETMVRGTPAQVQAEAQAALAATDGERFILGTGCVTPIVAPHGNVQAARSFAST